MEQLTHLWQVPLVRTAAGLTVALLVIALVVRLLRRAATRRIDDADLRYRTRKSVAVGGYVLVVGAVLFAFSDRLGGLTLVAGAAGAGVAFALQEVIGSFAGWAAIAFAGFYKVGDRVQVGGIRGDVIDVGFLRTTLMETGGWIDGDLYNGRLVRVANSFVFKEPVHNYSGEFEFVWDEIVVPIKHGSDFREGRAILEEAGRAITAEFAEGARARWAQLVRAYRLEDSSVDPLVTLVANDNWIALTLRYVVHFRRRRVTKDALFMRILDAVAATDGRVALASTTVQLVDLPALDVRVRGSVEPERRSEGSRA